MNFMPSEHQKDTGHLEDPMSISLDTGEMGLGRDELKNRLFIKLGLSMKAAKASSR